MGFRKHLPIKETLDRQINKLLCVCEKKIKIVEGTASFNR